MARIPKTLHYAFGLSRNFGGKPWSLVHYVCLKSAIERIRPKHAFFYYEHEPTGPWWSLSRPLVDPVRIAAPREIYGRPLTHVAHRADVIRIQKLIEYGGIYLDADVLVHRSFDDLLDYSCVLGSQGERGLCNAVILSEPSAPFLIRWLDQYQSFRGKEEQYWDEHSVLLPTTLANFFPEEVTTLPHTAFHWPFWTQDHLEWIFNSREPISLDGKYTTHLWESQAYQYFLGLTPGDVRSKQSNFCSWARPFLSNLPDDFGAAFMTNHVAPLRLAVTKKTRGLTNRARAKGRSISDKLAQILLSDKHLRRRTFSKIYKRGEWGRSADSKFFSGLGSIGAAATFYVEHMAELLQRHAQDKGRPLTIVDVGCGDFQVGRTLLEKLPGFSYIGCDIVEELIAHNKAAHSGSRITFRVLDVVRDPLPEGDVCLVRQVFQHLSNDDILKTLGHLKYPLIYITEGQPACIEGPPNPDKPTNSEVRFNWRTGRGRGVELSKPPFNLRTAQVFSVQRSATEIITTEQILERA